MLVLWRQPQKKTQYDWYTNGWCKDTKGEDLFKFIDEHLSNQVELQYQITESVELIDEHWHVSQHSFLVFYFLYFVFCYRQFSNVYDFQKNALVR